MGLSVEHQNTGSFCWLFGQIFCVKECKVHGSLGDIQNVGAQMVKWGSFLGVKIMVGHWVSGHKRGGSF